MKTNLRKDTIDGVEISYDKDSNYGMVEVRLDGVWIKAFATLREARTHIERNPRGTKAFKIAENSWEKELRYVSPAELQAYTGKHGSAS